MLATKTINFKQAIANSQQQQDTALALITTCGNFLRTYSKAVEMGLIQNKELSKDALCSAVNLIGLLYEKTLPPKM
jgi:hypothetical protein